MKKNILVVGGRGNLGTVLTPLLIKKYNVLIPDRNQMDQWSQISVTSAPHSRFLFDSVIPDLVLNLATFYSANPSSNDLLKMKNSINGVAETIRKLNTYWTVPVVSASSYFQFAPSKLEPWSEYAEMKKRATSLLRESCISIGTGFTEVVLYDNYGGSRKNKFFDVLLNSFVNRRMLSATPGMSLLNLLSVSNQAQGFRDIIDSIFDNQVGTSRVFGLYSEKTWTLRDLDTHISKLIGVPSNVIWGALPYRDKEVFEVWGKQELPNLWREDHGALDRYILESIK